MSTFCPVARQTPICEKSVSIPVAIVPSCEQESNGALLHDRYLRRAVERQPSCNVNAKFL